MGRRWPDPWLLSLALVPAGSVIIALTLLGLEYAKNSTGDPRVGPVAGQIRQNPSTAPAAAAHALGDKTALPARSEEALPAAAPPVRITITGTGFDVRVLPLTPSSSDLKSRELVPPQTVEAYWLTPYGRPGTGSDNTTYVVGHSWVDRDAPFNLLSTDVRPGHNIVVTTATGLLNYRVTAVERFSKAELRESAVWAVVPHRLVIISSDMADPRGTNVVVKAAPR